MKKRKKKDLSKPIKQDSVSQVLETILYEKCGGFISALHEKMGTSYSVLYSILKKEPKQRQKRIAMTLCKNSDGLLKMEDFGYESF